jgi:hypothetical protein
MTPLRTYSRRATEPAELKLAFWEFTSLHSARADDPEIERNRDGFLIGRKIIPLRVIASIAARDWFDWVPYVNQRFGFSLRYPANLFEPERRSEAGDGEVFTGVRGRGRLLVGALENSDGHTVGSYMNMIRQQSYGGYTVDYAPHGATWFVLSGQNDRDVFYEKVMFSCAGRLINSFALIYPIESKREFDPIVEGIEKTFRPGQDCGRYAAR